MTDTQTTPSAESKKMPLMKKIAIGIAALLIIAGIGNVTFNILSGGATVTVTDSTIVVAPVVDAPIVVASAVVDTAKKDTTK